MRKPLVSIITPCYNGESFLERYYESVLAQTYSELELIFVNDGSTDGTEKIALSYESRFREKGIRYIYIKQENRGQASALNRGLKLFHGEYLTWPDSDDIIMPEFIEKKVSFLQTHPKYVYCYGKAICVNEDDPCQVIDICEKRKQTGQLQFFEDILFVNNVFFCGYMVKTSALDHVLRGREIYEGEGGQNAQLLLPLAWYFGEPGYVEESVYKYFVRADSHSHSQKTSELIIRQLSNYEKILVATLQKISDNNAYDYIEKVQKHYAKLRFGNAVDTKKSDLIKKYYRELRSVNAVTGHDFALYIKYTNIIIRKMCKL